MYIYRWLVDVPWDPKVDGMDGGTTCIFVDGTGRRPTGSQGPIWDKIDSGTTCITLVDVPLDPKGCPTIRQYRRTIH